MEQKFLIERVAKNKLPTLKYVDENGCHGLREYAVTLGEVFLMM